jgi:hypothetical protein
MPGETRTSEFSTLLLFVWIAAKRRTCTVDSCGAGSGACRSDTVGKTLAYAKSEPAAIVCVRCRHSTSVGEHRRTQRYIVINNAASAMCIAQIPNALLRVVVVVSHCLRLHQLDLSLRV